MKLNFKNLVKQSNTHEEFIDTVDKLVQGNARERSQYTEPLLKYHFESEPTFRHLKPKYYNFETDKIPYHLKSKIPFLANHVSGGTTPYIDGCIEYQATGEVISVSKKTRDNRDKGKSAKGKTVLEEMRFSAAEGFDGHIHSSSEEFLSQKSYIQSRLSKYKNFLWIPDKLISQNWANIQKIIQGLNPSEWEPTTWRPDNLNLDYMRKEGERVFAEKLAHFKKNPNKIWMNQYDWKTGIGKTTPIVLGLEFDFLNILPIVNQDVFIGEVVNPRNKACNQNLKAVLQHFTAKGHPVEQVLISGPSRKEIRDSLQEDDDGTDFSDLPIKKFAGEKDFFEYAKNAVKNKTHFIVHRTYNTNKITKKVFETLGVRSFVYCDEYHWTTLPPTQTWGIMNGPYPMFGKDGLTGTPRGKFELPKKYKNLDYGQDNEKVMGKIRSSIDRNTAHKLGFVPALRNVIPSFDKDFMEQTFGTNWKEIYENNEYVKPSNAKKFSNLTLTIDQYIGFHNLIEQMDNDIGHCAIHKCFTIQDCREEERNFKTMLPSILGPKKGTKNYTRLSNIVTYVADTHNKNKSRIWSEIGDILHEADIKKQFVIIFFADLLGESWSPKPSGIIDIESFSQNTRSKLKFMQTVGRGDRQGHKDLFFKKRFNNVSFPMFHVEGDDEFNENNFFKNLHDYCRYTKEDPEQLWENTILLHTSSTRKKKKGKKRKASTVTPTTVVTNLIKLKKYAKQIKRVWTEVKQREKYTNLLFDYLFPAQEKLSRQERFGGATKRYVVKNITAITNKFKKIMTGTRMPNQKSRINKAMRVVWGLDSYLYPENLRKALLLKEADKSEGEEYTLAYQKILYDLFNDLLKNTAKIPMGTKSGNVDATQSIFTPVRDQIKRLKNKYGYDADYDETPGFVKRNKKLESDYEKILKFQLSRWSKFEKDIGAAIDKVVAVMPSNPVGRFYEHPVIVKVRKSYPLTEKQFLDTIKNYLQENKEHIIKQQTKNTISLTKKLYKNFETFKGNINDCYTATIKQYRSKNTVAKHINLGISDRSIMYNNNVVVIVPGVKKAPGAMPQKQFEKLKQAVTDKRVKAGLQKKDNTGKAVKIYCLGKVYDSIQKLVDANLTVPRQYRTFTPKKTVWRSNGKSGITVRKVKSGNPKYQHSMRSREKIFKLIADKKNSKWIRYV